MRKGWEIKKLNEVSTISYGYTDSASLIDVGPKFLRITDIQNNSVAWDTVPYCMCKKEELPKYKLEDGDMVFARTGATTGKSFLIKHPPVSVFASYLIRLKVFSKDELLPEFIALYFQTEDYWNHIKAGVSGSAQGGFNATKLGEIQIPLPPLSEQKRIVSILDRAFAAIDKAKANTEKNLQNAKELFESYLQKVFEEKGEDWEEKKLEDVLVRTEMIDPTKYPEKEFIYLDVSSVNKETKEIETPALILGKDAPSRARKLVKTNDIIFATVRPTHNRIALIKNEYNNQVCSTGYFVLRTKESIYPNLVYYWLMTKKFNDQMEKLQKGASYPAVTDNDVKNQTIYYPSLLSKQNNIAQQLERLSVEIKKIESFYQQKLTSLDELKKSILQKAFSGQLSESRIFTD